MMNGLGRRYFAFSGTKRGKARITGAMLFVAIASILSGMLLAGNPHVDQHLAGAMVGFGIGLLLVAVISMFVNRKAA